MIDCAEIDISPKRSDDVQRRIESLRNGNRSGRKVHHKIRHLAHISSYAAILVVIGSLVAVSYQSPIESRLSGQASSRATIEIEKPSVDQLAATELAAKTALTANLPVASNVTSLSASLSAKSQLAQTDEDVLSKPQIIEVGGELRGISSYTAAAGDTVDKVAAQFGITPQTIKWANNLSSDALTPGQQLFVPGIDGVVYVVKSGDTTASLAQKYNAQEARIISYNDLEFSGLSAGARIVIPDGVLPEAERPGYVNPNTTSRYAVVPYGGFTRAYVGSSGNGYAYGYCTWYAYNRRSELGRPIGGFWGDAVTWASYARASGFRVDNTPEAGAVLQAPWVAAPYGHVAVVESVGSDGSLVVSEMNYAGWNVVSTRTVPADTARSYNYIH